MTELDAIVPVDPAQHDIWTDCMRIYERAFPRWERESEGALRRRLDSGRYRMRAGLRDGRPVGFVTLDIEPPHIFALLTYLVIDEAERGKGYGTVLTEEAIRLFLEETGCNWLLIEAEDRQAELYGRLGFMKIDIAFFVPRFDNMSVVPMHLLVYPRRSGATYLDERELKEMIDWIYRSGYMLGDDDPRLAQQLAAIEGDARLIPWPPER